MRQMDDNRDRNKQIKKLVDELAKLNEYKKKENKSEMATPRKPSD